MALSSSDLLNSLLHRARHKVDLDVKAVQGAPEAKEISLADMANAISLKHSETTAIPKQRTNASSILSNSTYTHLAIYAHFAPTSAKRETAVGNSSQPDSNHEL